MNEIYSSNLGDYGYYDQSKGLCVPPSTKAKTAAKAEPAEKARQIANLLPLPNPSFEAEFTKGLTELLFSPWGCGGGSAGASNVCLSDSSPKYPSAGINPTPALIAPEDIASGGKGVDLTWQFSIANCDGSAKNMKVRIYFSSDKTLFGDYTPDEKGIVTVSRHFEPGAYPSTNPLLGDLYFYNPESSQAPQPLLNALSLYLPQVKDKTPVQQPNCAYSDNPSIDGITSSTGDSVDFGQSVRLTISPEKCDGTAAAKQSDLNVDFKVDGKWVVSDLHNAAAIKFDNGSYYLDHVFAQTGQQWVTVKVSDAVRGGQPTKQTYPIYVSPSNASVDIYASSNDGFMARRPVTLDAGWNTGRPAGNVNFAWTITDPASKPVATTPASGKQVSFTPTIDGMYDVTLTITGDQLAKPIIKPGQQIKVWPFSKPKAIISGEQYPVSGAPVSYKARLVPQERQLSAEDDGAVCTWTLSHTDLATNSPVVDINKQAKSCNEQIAFTYPTVIQQTNYVLQVNVAGADQAYTAIGESLPIFVNPPAVNQSGAAFSVKYDADGAIPFRPVTLNGTLVGAPAGLNLTYKWTIKDMLDNPLSTQPADGAAATYSFNAAGTYKTKLSVYGDDPSKPLATKEDSVIIYEFPKPAVIPVINNKQTIYAGQSVPLTVQLDRSFPEDINASYTWKISHRLYDPAAGASKEILDLDPATAAAQKRDLTFTFASQQNYLIEVTVTGRNGSTAVYTAKASPLVDVWQSSIAAPGISAPGLGNQGIDIPFTVSNPDPNLTYTWNFGDGPAKLDGTSVNHKYLSTGTFPVTVTAANLDGTAKATSVPWNVTVVLAAGGLTTPGISAPGKVDQGISFPLEVSNPDPNLTYTWNFGDGSSAVGASVTHTFFKTGTFPVTVMAAGTDGSTIVTQPWNIGVYAANFTNPIPNLTVSPGQGPAPLSVVADASGSYATVDGATITDYTFNWGDKSAPESGLQASRAHQFECSNASCNYTVQLTVTDSNGKKSPITTVVSIWQP